MSINDILEDKSLIPFLISLFCIVMLVKGIIFIIKAPFDRIKYNRIYKEIYGDINIEADKVVTQENVRVVRKSHFSHPIDDSIVNVVQFEAFNGVRIELAIENEYTYHSIIEDDVGRLQYQGKRFISFKRYLKTNF